MYPFKFLAFTLLCASAALCESSSAAKPSRDAGSRFNVLFLICDDLNCDLGSYGHPQVKSPNIDKLAKRGVRFEHAYCQFPLCGPSRASFMTGLYPDQTLVHKNGVYIREHTPNVKTIPQMFREAEYFATRIGKIYHYNVPKNIGTSGHDDPYSWNYTINPRGRDVTDEPLITTLQKDQFGGTLSWLAADGTDREQTDGIAATEAIRELKKYAADKTPFYLAVGLYRPHTPYVAPKKYFDMYPLDKIAVPSVPDGYLDTIPKPAQQSIRRKKDQIDLADDVARHAIQAYYASITFADAQVGRILKALDETGLAENTVVLFTSDHGYHMGEHGHWQKTTLFENATRVPLIIAVPPALRGPNGEEWGVTAQGGVARSPVEMVDFYPTLAELCGLAPPDSISGVSLVPALRDPKATPRETALSQYGNGYSIRQTRFRYTEWGENGAEGAELYDHNADPAEMKNLADNPEHAATVKRLSGLLHSRIKEALTAPKGVNQLRFDDNRKVPVVNTYAPR